MRPYSMFLFLAVCLNVSASIFYYAQIIPVRRELYATPTQILAQFNFETLILLVIGGVGSGLIGILTRQYVAAAGIMVLWALGSLIEPLKWIFFGAPAMVSALLPADGSLWYIPSVLQVFIGFSFFWFIIEIATQRQIT